MSFRPRVIPVLLNKSGELYKTVGFKKPRYIGDAINAVRLFNEFRADEIVILDIEASSDGRVFDENLVDEIGAEADMPFVVGGGVSNLKQIECILKAGAEKVVIGNAALVNKDFVKEAVLAFGGSTICVCIDIKRTFWGKPRVYSHVSRKKLSYPPTVFARMMEDIGVGELIIQDVDRDGSMEGYDIELIKRAADAVAIPIIALGGAGSKKDLERAFLEGNANAVAAGSMFVYVGSNNGVLINYLPDGKPKFDR